MALASNAPSAPSTFVGQLLGPDSVMIPAPETGAPQAPRDPTIITVHDRRVCTSFKMSSKALQPDGRKPGRWSAHVAHPLRCRYDHYLMCQVVTFVTTQAKGCMSCGPGAIAPLMRQLSIFCCPAASPDDLRMCGHPGLRCVSVYRCGTETSMAELLCMCSYGDGCKMILTWNPCPSCQR